MALFVQRAQAVKPEFQLSEANARTIAQICQRLEGLPLALELAAARIKLFTPVTLLTRLDHRLSLLSSRRQDVPERQQTLRNAISWSYDLLTREEQAFLRRLCIFAGGCTLEAAEAVCMAPGDLSVPALDLAASLLDQSLLQQREQAMQEPRLRLLEMIREYGLEVLTAYLIITHKSEPREGPREEGAGATSSPDRRADASRARWSARLDRHHFYVLRTPPVERPSGRLAAR